MLGIGGVCAREAAEEVEALAKSLETSLEVILFAGAVVMVSVPMTAISRVKAHALEQSKTFLQIPGDFKGWHTTCVEKEKDGFLADLRDLKVGPAPPFLLPVVSSIGRLYQGGTSMEQHLWSIFRNPIRLDKIIPLLAERADCIVCFGHIPAVNDLANGTPVLNAFVQPLGLLEKLLQAWKVTRKRLPAPSFSVEPFGIIPPRSEGGATLVMCSQEERKIESRLCELEAVVQCVVVLHTSTSQGQSGANGLEEKGNAFLAAYIVPENKALVDEEKGGSELVAVLRDHLTQHLPSYMVPSAFVLLDILPTNSSGKVDRKRLPVPSFSVEPVGIIPPRSEGEERLARLVCSVLGVKHLGMHQNLFEVGANSLTIIVLLARVRLSFGATVPIQQLFSHPTLTTLADLCLGRVQGDRDGEGKLSVRVSRKASPRRRDLSIRADVGESVAKADASERPNVLDYSWSNRCSSALFLLVLFGPIFAHEFHKGSDAFFTSIHVPEVFWPAIRNTLRLHGASIPAIIIVQGLMTGNQRARNTTLSLVFRSLVLRLIMFAGITFLIWSINSVFGTKGHSLGTFMPQFWLFIGTTFIGVVFQLLGLVGVSRQRLSLTIAAAHFLFLLPSRNSITSTLGFLPVPIAFQQVLRQQGNIGDVATLLSIGHLLAPVARKFVLGSWWRFVPWFLCLLRLIVSALFRDLFSQPSFKGSLSFQSLIAYVVVAWAVLTVSPSHAGVVSISGRTVFVSLLVHNFIQLALDAGQTPAMQVARWASYLIGPVLAILLHVALVFFQAVLFSPTAMVFLCSGGGSITLRTFCSFSWLSEISSSGSVRGRVLRATRGLRIRQVALWLVAALAIGIGFYSGQSDILETDPLV